MILLWDKGIGYACLLYFDLDEEGTSEVKLLTSLPYCPVFWLALLSGVRRCKLDSFYLEQNQRLHSQSPPDSPVVLGV